MKRQTAIILDSDQNQRDELRACLLRCGVLPIVFQEEWICLENIHHIKPVFGVLRTGSFERVFRFVNLTRAIDSGFPVIVLSNEAGVEQFVRSNWLENLFFLRCPVDDREFQQAIDLLATARPDGKQPVLIAGSPDRRKLMQGLPLLGLSREPILIQGERGVGKKLVARAIHGFSAARQAALEIVDAGDVTGSWIRSAGRQAAAGDDASGRPAVRVIGDVENLPHPIQSQLLLLMESRNGNGGGDGSHLPSAPLITLTGADLEALARRGRFRKDLYHRLSVLKVAIPPLRGHAADIRAMAEYFALQFGIQRNGGVCRLPDAVLDSLAVYHWPGNVAELKSFVQRLVLTDKAGWVRAVASLTPDRTRRAPDEPAIIRADDVRDYLRRHADVSLKTARDRYAAQVEKKIMGAALKQTNGNCKKAAGLLNISYKSMLNKAKEYRLV